MSEWRKQSISIVDDLILRDSLFKNLYFTKNNPQNQLLLKLNLFEGCLKLSNYDFKAFRNYRLKEMIRFFG